jgi:hypothetical protein
MEKWKPVNGYDGKYEISSYGRLMRGTKVIVGSTNRSGQRVYLLFSKVQELKYASRMVAEHFVPNPGNLRYVVHRDNNIENNYQGNLKWHHSPRNSVIDSETIEHIKYSTMSIRDLAEIYNVSVSTIQKIKSR